MIFLCKTHGVQMRWRTMKDYTISCNDIAQSHCDFSLCVVPFLLLSFSCYYYFMLRLFILCYLCRTIAPVATVICWLYPTLNKFYLILHVSYLEVVSMFFKKYFKPIFYGRDGGCSSKHVLGALNRIAVQNNALISIISFTLKQVNWFCQPFLT